MQNYKKLRLAFIYNWLISQKILASLFGSKKCILLNSSIWFSRRPRLYRSTWKPKTSLENFPMHLTLQLFWFSWQVLKTKCLDKLITMLLKKCNPLIVQCPVFINLVNALKFLVENPKSATIYKIFEVNFLAAKQS